MKFTIAIEPGTKKTAFGIVVPDLPGCFSAGDTVEEAFDNAREIIDDPAEKINITVPALTLKRIDEYAMKHGESRSRFLVRAAEESMRKAG